MIFDSDSIVGACIHPQDNRLLIHAKPRLETRWLKVWQLVNITRRRRFLPALSLVTHPMLQHTIFKQCKDAMSIARKEIMARIIFLLRASGWLLAGSIAFPYFTAKFHLHVDIYIPIHCSFHKEERRKLTTSESWYFRTCPTKMALNAKIWPGAPMVLLFDYINRLFETQVASEPDINFKPAMFDTPLSRQRIVY